MKIKKFHQFVTLEIGPVNTAIVNFLKGDIYLEKNERIEKFIKGEYKEIKDFVDFLETEGLIIEIEKDRCIPMIKFNRDDDKV